MKTRLISLAIIDICNFTALSVVSSQNELLELIEKVKKTISHVVSKHNGQIVTELGDAFLVTFTAPLYSIRASKEIIKILSERPIYALGKPIQVKVALHTGEADFHEQKPVGSIVKTVLAIEKHALPSELIVTGTTAKSCDSPEFRFLNSGKIYLPSVGDYEDIYTVAEKLIAGSEESSLINIPSPAPSRNDFFIGEAPNSRRVFAGLIDVWLSILLLVLTLLCLQINHFTNYFIHTVSWSLKNASKQEFKFDGPKGTYDVYFAFTLLKERPYEAAKITLNDTTYLIHFLWMSDNKPQLQVVARNIPIAEGQPIQLDIPPINVDLVPSFFEFYPSGSYNTRNTGNENYFSPRWMHCLSSGISPLKDYWYLLIPLSVFSSMVIFQSLFSRTAGQIILGLMVSDERSGKKISPAVAIKRSIAWLFIPFWGFRDATKRRKFTDSVSHTKTLYIFEKNCIQ